MVQMTEFRVVMPVSVEEYRVAQMYMVTNMQEQQTSGSEGVEVLVNEPYEDAEFGKGQYTSKIYHLQSKAPAWLIAIAPKKALLIEEEAWNAYPKCKTILRCPYFNRFKITVETIHVADTGRSTNVHNLPSGALKIRKVEMIDIALNVRDYWSYMLGGDPVDVANFKSEKTGRGKLVPGWQDTCDPVMTAYKLVTVDAPYWGFGYRLEQLALGLEKALFIESHKRCFLWIDEWFGHSFDDMRVLELQTDESLRQTMSRHGALQQQKANSLKSEGSGNEVSSFTEAGQSNVLKISPPADRQTKVDSQENHSQGELVGDGKVSTKLCPFS